MHGIVKILHVVPYFYPALNFGGPAKVAYELCKELSGKYSVTVFTSDAWDGRRRMEENERLKGDRNFTAYYFKNLFNIFSYQNRIFTNFGIIFRYLKQRNEFDIIHVHDVFSLPQIFLLYLASLFRMPYVFSPHGTLDPIRMENKFLLKSLLYQLFIKKILRQAKVIVATSSVEAQDLKRMGFRNVKAVYNGISSIKAVPSRKFNRHRKPELLTILYIGKMHPLKGLDKILMSLKDADFSCQFLIAGPDDGAEGYLRNIVKSQSIRNVHFLGYVDEKEKAELYSLADIFVYPSLSEGFSISILEAMKYKVPVLITDACSFPEVARERVGFVIPVESLEEKALQILKEAAGMKPQLKKMGLKGAVLVKKGYSIKKMAQDISRLYQISIR